MDNNQTKTNENVNQQLLKSPMSKAAIDEEEDENNDFDKIIEYVAILPKAKPSRISDVLWALPFRPADGQELRVAPNSPQRWLPTGLKINIPKDVVINVGCRHSDGRSAICVQGYSVAGPIKDFEVMLPYTNNTERAEVLRPDELIGRIWLANGETFMLDTP